MKHQILAAPITEPMRITSPNGIRTLRGVEGRRHHSWKHSVFWSFLFGVAFFGVFLSKVAFARHCDISAQYSVPEHGVNPESPDQSPQVATRSLSSSLGPPRVLSGPHSRIEFFNDNEGKEASKVMRIIEKCWEEYRRKNRPMPSGEITVVLCPTIADFMKLTEVEQYMAGGTVGSTIYLQPPSLLRNRGVLEGTLRHEFTHVAINSIPNMDAPLWLREGMAIVMSGQADLFPRKSKIKFEDDLALDEAIESPESEAESQAAYRVSYERVKDLIHRYGEATVWDLFRKDEEDWTVQVAPLHKESGRKHYLKK